MENKLIFNQTQNLIITEKVRICRTLFSQMRGLMFRKKQNLLMIFEQERIISLHNFFVFYPIDVLVLDYNLRVVEIKKNFRPGTFWNAQQKGKYLLELAFPAQYQVGDRFKLN